MALIGARHVTLQICILYKPENSVILLSENLCLERLFLTQRSTKADISAEIPGFRKTMDSSAEDEG